MKRFLIIFIFILSATEGLAKTCTTIFESKWATEKVEIIYFPQGPHDKLRVGEDVYSNNCPSSRCVHTTMEAIDRLKAAYSKGLQIRYSIMLTKEELSTLKQFIKEGEFGKNTVSCTHAACKALNKTAGVWVPIPFNISPVLNAVYLAIQRINPFSRVDEITIGGKADVGGAIGGILREGRTAVLLGVLLSIPGGTYYGYYQFIFWLTH